jgi:NAD(P)-dependent dehydrogenase (short-subunit alcohol dehydrogenase family)
MNSRVVLITGGSGKLGLALVSYFLAMGDRVVTTCRANDSLTHMRSVYGHWGDKFLAIEADLTLGNSACKLQEKLSVCGIKPDCLINNARSQKFLEIESDGTISRENFANEYLLDVIVPYELIMEMTKNVESSIRRVVNIGSQYGVVAANPNLYTDPLLQSPIHYGVAKAALTHLTKELSVRLASKSVQVNCVAFGGIGGRVDAAFEQRYSQLCPQGRMLRVDEVTGPIDMLLSDKCSGMTGHTLIVDGGWSVW